MKSARTTALGALLVCQAVLIAGLALSYPFLTLYLHGRRGLPMSVVGLAIGGSMLATAVGQGLGGEAADRWGCKRVMAAALASRGAFLALIAAAIAGGWPTAVIVALNVGGGFVGNFYDPAVRSWIAQEHAPAQRVRAYSLLRVATNASWAVGPALGGMLAGRSYGALFGVSAAVCGVCLALLLAFVPDAPASSAVEIESPWSGWAIALKDPRFLRFSILTVLISTSMGQLVSPLSAHAAALGLGESMIGRLFAVNGALVVILQTSAGSLIAGRALTSAAAAGCALYAAGWTVVGFGTGMGALALGVAIATLGEIVISPSLQTMAANLAPEGRRGRYMGIQGLSYQVGQSFGPALGGAGLQWLTWPPAPWLAAAALAGAAGFGFRRLEGRLTRAELGVTGGMAG